MISDGRADEPNHFTLIAHRGDSASAPENTFSSFDLAIEKGFDNVELDVQLTSDGVPVVIHDATLDRTTNASGPVSGISLADIQQLDAGSWKDAKFKGQQIRTLDEILKRYATKLRLHLELKSREQDLAERVAPLLKAHGLLNSSDVEYKAPGLTITSFAIEQLYRSRQLMPDVRHGWLLSAITPTDLKLAQHIGINGIYPNAQFATTETVSLAVDGGMRVRCWGIGNSEQALQSAFDSGATGTTVDWPDKAREFLTA
jgi:glycerophosphoryl diester phosphodiesterase